MKNSNLPSSAYPPRSFSLPSSQPPDGWQVRRDNFLCGTFRRCRNWRSRKNAFLIKISYIIIIFSGLGRYSSIGVIYSSGSFFTCLAGFAACNLFKAPGFYNRARGLTQFDILFLFRSTLFACRKCRKISGGWRLGWKSKF